MNPIAYIPAKTIVTRTKSTAWFGAAYNMNIYRGCCHGCIYCDSRSSCYGTDHFDQVRAKQDALRIIRDDLRRKVKTGVISTGAMSDPYNPYEKELLLTRHALELAGAYGFGIAIATKSDLIVRDMDVLQEIREHSPVICKITVTAAEDSLSRLVEPYAPPSSKRLEAVRQLSEAGLFAGILMMPVLPLIEDTEENILGIIEKAGQCGARFIYPAFGMTLRQNQREWYLSRVEELFPGQGLRLRYEKQYGQRYECPSPRAKKLWELFSRECEKRGILFRMQDIIRASRLDCESRQMTLF